jgi:competence ComEA-like helix-hairpin-helix protein
MNLNWEPIKEWFGFTRRERRSTFVMLLIVTVIIGLRYTIPESNMTIEDISSIISSDTLIETGPIEKKPGTLLSYRIEEATAGKHLSKPQKTRININTCDSSTLVRLPGIGPVLSVRIIKYRHLLGGFASVDQLKEVYGLPVETYEKIKGRVFTDSTSITRININSVTYKEIIGIPYFEKYEAAAILKYRELKGRISGIQDLTENKLITPEKARKVGPYLKYDE